MTAVLSPYIVTGKRPDGRTVTIPASSREEAEAWRLKLDHCTDVSIDPR